MSNALEDVQRFRALNVIDDFNRECPGAVVDTSIGGARVARELDRIAELHGYLSQRPADKSVRGGARIDRQPICATEPVTINNIQKNATIPRDFIGKPWPTSFEMNDCRKWLHQSLVSVHF